MCKKIYLIRYKQFKTLTRRVYVDLSIFFARLFGLYFLIFAALWVVFKDQFEISLREIIASRSLIFLSGVMNLLFGLAIVIVHPHWGWQWLVAPIQDRTAVDALPDSGLLNQRAELF